MKSSFSKNVLRSVVTLSFCVGGALDIGAKAFGSADFTRTLSKLIGKQKVDVNPRTMQLSEANIPSRTKKLEDEVINNVPEKFKEYNIETLGNLFSYVNCTSELIDDEISKAKSPIYMPKRLLFIDNLAVYTKSLERLFPNSIIFNGAKKKIKNFDSFIYALGKTMSDYTRAYYNDEAKLKSSKEQTWKYQRKTGLAAGWFGHWGYDEVDKLTRKLILIKLQKEGIWE